LTKIEARRAVGAISAMRLLSGRLMRRFAEMSLAYNLIRNG
jgi:hypothetical protein